MVSFLVYSIVVACFLGMALSIEAANRKAKMKRR